MTVTISLPPETARRLDELAARSGQTLASYLQQLAEQAAAASNGLHPDQVAAPWESAFRAWAAGHPSLPQTADDSRASIYAGRGE